MKPGDIIFVRGNSIISKAVRLFDKGRFSHVAVAVSDTHVIETNWNMRSRIVPFYYEDFELVRLDLTEKQRMMVPVAAKKLEGRFYDYLQILGILLFSRVNSPRYLICSELVYYVLKGVGYLTDERLQDATPNELYTALTAEGGWGSWNKS